MTRAACRRPGGLELTDRLLAAARLTAGVAVLDVGCGAGATVAHLVDGHGLRAVGVDVSATQIEEASAARPDLDFIAGRAEQLPFPDASFDGVACECVLSTLSDPGAALSEMARVLTPGGVALLSDVYVRAGDDSHTGAIPALGSRDAVERLLAAAGLRVVLWSDESGALARYLWDRASARDTGRAPPPESRTPARGRRLGYFMCVARAGG